MKNIFKILSVIACLLGTTLSANPNSVFMTLDKKIKKANEAFIDTFSDLRKQNIIPKEYKLNPDNSAQNNLVLHYMFEAIKQKPELAPENNLYIKTLLEKIEKLNYLQIRKLIGCMQSNEGTNSKTVITLTEQDRNKSLSILHDLYKFKDTTEAHPFRSIIRDIFIYVSYLANLSNFKISYESKQAMLALFLDKTSQQILKIKQAHPGCTIKTEDLNLLVNILKSYSIAKFPLKKILINTTIATVTVLTIAAIIWYINKNGIPTLQTLEIFVGRLIANTLNQAHAAGLGARGLGNFVANEIPVPEYPH